MQGQCCSGGGCMLVGVWHGVRAAAEVFLGCGMHLSNQGMGCRRCSLRRAWWYACSSLLFPGGRLVSSEAGSGAQGVWRRLGTAGLPHSLSAAAGMWFHACMHGGEAVIVVQRVQRRLSRGGCCPSSNWAVRVTCYDEYPTTTGPLLLPAMVCLSPRSSRVTKASRLPPPPAGRLPQDEVTSVCCKYCCC